jgi:lysylphosphatidylglycerol synthetase-like protein (DUF2156 family)
MKKVLYIISPCFFAVIFSLFAVIAGYLQMEESGGWSYLATIVFLPVLIITSVLYFLVRIIFKKRIQYIWGTEIIAIIIIYLVQLRKFF